MQKKLLLTELIHNLEQEMLRLGYTKRSMEFYRRRWRMLLQFAKERRELFYSEQLGIDFVEKRFNVFEKDDDRGLSAKDVQELRIIRMIGDFQLHHTILRNYRKHKDILTNPSFSALRKQFQSYCEGKEYSKGTTVQHVKNPARFMHYTHRE